MIGTDVQRTYSTSKKKNTQHEQRHNINSHPSSEGFLLYKENMKIDSAYGIIPLMQKDDTRYTVIIHLSSGNHR